jgi:hypothetical protein
LLVPVLSFKLNRKASLGYFTRPTANLKLEYTAGELASNKNEIGQGEKGARAPRTEVCEAFVGDPERDISSTSVTEPRIGE